MLDSTWGDDERSSWGGMCHKKNPDGYGCEEEHLKKTKPKLRKCFYAALLPSSSPAASLTIQTERMTFSATPLLSVRLLVFCIYYVFFKDVFKPQTGTNNLPCTFC